MNRLRRCNALLATVIAALLAPPAWTAHQLAEPSELQTSVSLYLWLPSIDGDLRFDTGGGDSTIDAGDILGALQMAFMGTLEFRKEKWSLLADLIYLDLGNDRISQVGLPGGGSVATSVDLGLSGWQLGLYGGYQVHRSDKSNLFLLAGARHLSIEADAQLGLTAPLPPGLPSAMLERSASVTDAIVGLRGRVVLDRHWFIPYHADVGAGESDLTWQAMTGIGYAADWGDMTLIYRHLTWDQGDDDMLQGLTFSGPGIAARYYF